MSETPCGFLSLKKKKSIKPPGETPSFKSIKTMLTLSQETEPHLLRLETSLKTCLYYVFIFNHVVFAMINRTH